MLENLSQIVYVKVNKALSLVDFPYDGFKMACSPESKHMAKHRIAGINFDHQHMGDLLRLVMQHDEAEIVGICHADAEKMQPVIDLLRIPQQLVFTDYRQCIETCSPTVAILCPSTATHGEWVCNVAPYELDILLEKPFAASLSEADTIIAAMNKTGKRLAVNWPLAWYPPHCTAKRLIDEGAIGQVLNVHYYDGNKGPVRHTVDKITVAGEELVRAKRESWFYDPVLGGGSLMDYLGYGATLATWYMHGRKPIEVTAMVDQPVGLDVDEHSVTVARYETGLSKFETRWGTFTDPWTHQPQPKCGFVLCGDKGTISSYDYELAIGIQDAACPEGKEIPVDDLKPPWSDPITYFLHCLDNDLPVEGPLSPEIARIGQQIVDTAWHSSRLKRTLALRET